MSGLSTALLIASTDAPKKSKCLSTKRSFADAGTGTLVLTSYMNKVTKLEGELQGLKEKILSLEDIVLSYSDSPPRYPQETIVFVNILIYILSTTVHAMLRPYVTLHIGCNNIHSCNILYVLMPA